MPNSGVDSLPDQISFELSDRGDNCEKRLTKRTGGVNVFLVGDELYAERAEFFEREQQMLGASSEAVKAPNHDGVELPLTCVGHEFVKFGTRVLRSGMADVDVLADDSETPSRAVRPEVAHLHIAALV